MISKAKYGAVMQELTMKEEEEAPTERKVAPVVKTTEAFPLNSFLIVFLSNLTHLPIFYIYLHDDALVNLRLQLISLPF